MSNQIHYSEATIADIDLLVNYRLQFLTELFGIQPAETEAALKESLNGYFRKALTDGTYTCRIAWQDKLAIGLGGMVSWQKPGSYKMPGGKVGYILNMYTLPAYRKRGIGSRLLEKLMSAAKEAGIEILELHATDDGAPVYRKYGFSEPKSPVMEMKL
jgi:GNAT superfamily N-acetyltransferase